MSKKIILAGLGVLLVAAIAKANSSTGNNNSTGQKWQILRAANVLRSDAEGSGAYNASRGGRKHNGIDLVASVGVDVVAPFDGVVSRHSVPYANDTRYKGIELTSGLMKLKIFYCVPNFEVGARVSKGQRIATVQNISAKYSSKMINHIHIELYINDVLQNPTNYFL